MSNAAYLHISSFWGGIARRPCKNFWLPASLISTTCMTSWLLRNRHTWTQLRCEGARPQDLAWWAHFQIKLATSSNGETHIQLVAIQTKMHRNGAVRDRWSAAIVGTKDMLVGSHLSCKGQACTWCHFKGRFEHCYQGKQSGQQHGQPKGDSHCTRAKWHSFTCAWQWTQLVSPTLSLGQCMWPGWGFRISTRSLQSRTQDPSAPPSPRPFLTLSFQTMGSTNCLSLHNFDRSPVLAVQGIFECQHSSWIAHVLSTSMCSMTPVHLSLGETCSLI